MKIHLTNSAVILSEAKDLSLIYGDQIIKRWKTWPRGLRPLRCRFALPV